MNRQEEHVRSGRGDYIKGQLLRTPQKTILDADFNGAAVGAYTLVKMADTVTDFAIATYTAPVDCHGVVCIRSHVGVNVANYPYVISLFNAAVQLENTWGHVPQNNGYDSRTTLYEMDLTAGVSYNFKVAYYLVTGGSTIKVLTGSTITLRVDNHP